MSSQVNQVAYTMLGSPNGTANDSFMYDSNGRLASSFTESNTWGTSNQHADPGTRHSLAYNDRDQVVRDDVTNEARGGTQGISYGYNPNGSRQFMIVDVKDAFGNDTVAQYPKVRFEYTYDVIGRLADISAYYQPATGNPITPAIARATYSYDANGRIITVRTLKSTILYEYNDAGQLIGQINATKDGLLDPFAPINYNFTDPHNGTSHTKLSEFTNISYNARGHIISMGFLAATTLGTSQQQTAYGTGSVTFGYDGGGRLLTEAWTDSGSSTVNLVHEYDNADNLKKLRGNTWTTDSGSDQVLTGSLAGYTSPSYNASGEVTALNGFEFMYGASGRLGLITGTSQDKGVFANVALDQRSNYDAEGLRTYQTFSFGGSAGPNNNEQMFLYDGTSLVCRWVGQWGPGGSHNFTNAVSDLGQPWAPDAFVLYLWGPTGPVMEFDMLGNSKALLYDPLGNTLNTTTEQGLAEKPLFYDGYGLPVWPDEPNSQRMRRHPLQYKGQAGYYADVHTGLYYCHNRYYDPRLARWLSRDPIGLEGGINLYSYCGGNPVMFWDPSGLQVGPPTGLNGFEECIPIWGPGRDAINEFQTGQYGWGIFHTIVAMSDIFLVKSAIVGVAKATSKVGVRAGARTLSQSGFKKGTRQILNKAGIWKSGSNTWGATRKWAMQTGFAEPYVPLHHWFFAQNSNLGKLVATNVKNQPWNLISVKPYRGYEPNVVHQALHGKGSDLRLSAMQKVMLGTPAWAKAFGISFGGRLVH